MIEPSVVSELVDYVLNKGAYKATTYLSKDFTVKATRKRYDGKINKRARTVDIILTIGKPNYEERERMKRAKKNGWDFPGTVVKYPKQ
jgi:hypothetical protein